MDLQLIWLLFGTKKVALVKDGGCSMKNYIQYSNKFIQQRNRYTNQNNVKLIDKIQI